MRPRLLKRVRKQAKLRHSFFCGLLVGGRPHRAGGADAGRAGPSLPTPRRPKGWRALPLCRILSDAQPPTHALTDVLNAACARAPR